MTQRKSEPPASGHILDPRFKYTSSANTDLRKTFARVRKRLREESTAPNAVPNVTPIKTKYG